METRVKFWGVGSKGRTGVTEPSQEAELHMRPAKEALRIDAAVQAMTDMARQAAAHECIGRGYN